MKQLGIFAKYWQPGKVKTRLARAIGATSASELHRRFVASLLARFHGLADRHQLCFSPPERRQDFAALAGSGWQLSPQTRGELGQRMHAFFEASFRDGCNRTVLIGSDSPTLPNGHIERAFELLVRYPVVLGSTADGGYYLVGAAQQTPPIFAGIEWSTPRVWDQTIALLRRESIPFAQLPPWYDIDLVDDLIQLRTELRGLVEQASQWSSLLEAVEQALYRVK